MNEDDYIIATNLAKARIATDVVRAMLFLDDGDSAIQKAMIQNLYAWIDRYEGILNAETLCEKQSGESHD